MRWLISSTNKEYLNYLASSASISPTIAQILVNRNIKTPEQVKKFLSPSLDDLHDPFFLPDMKRAVERIHKAKKNKEKVLVFGDYDVDGLSATALLLDALERLGICADFMIPNRLIEGYGLSSEALRAAAQKGVSLLITVDCGISAVEEARLARNLGMDLIITDHHQQTGPLPEAFAVVNPHRTDSSYPFKDLAGAGVAYKLAEAVLGNEAAVSLLDLAAMGTMADIVPLQDENRIIVKAGIDMINNTERPGIQALKEIAENSGRPVTKITSTTFAFVLAPRINAAGRLGDAAPVVELFRTKDKNKAATLAALLEENNKKRREIDALLLKEARDKLNAKRSQIVSRQSLKTVRSELGVVALGAEGWHPGVLGIVASKLSDELHLPVFLFSIENGLARGSGRSIPPFNMIGALEKCSHILEAFGGHHQAAGVRLKTSNMDVFRDKMSEFLVESVGVEGYTPPLQIDAAVELSDVGFELVREIQMLEPFGFQNEEPVLGCKAVETMTPRVVGKNHLKMRLKKGRQILDSIGFGMGSEVERIKGGGLMIDTVFVPRLNEWEGRTTIQLQLKELRPNRTT